MRIQLGYVALPLSFDITSSSTMTYTEFIKQGRPYERLHQIIENNLKSLYQILEYNYKNNIHFFRITSKLIPLATHEDVNYDYITPHLEMFHKLANRIKKDHIRVDFHPDQFTVLNSTNPKVLENTKRILEYHIKIIKALDIENPVLILHVGSNAFGKQKSIQRFINNFKKLDSFTQKCIAIENDDKIFNIDDIIQIYDEIQTPIVLDYHHHLCNHNNIEILPYFDKIKSSWKNQNMKIHFSSPKSKTKKEIRSHHDYINSVEFINFINKVKSSTISFDIMIEAKGKDEALFRLIRNLKYRTNYLFLDDTTFIIQ